MAASGGTTEYILLNRDTPLLAFACSRTEFDEPEFTELEWLSDPANRARIGHIGMMEEGVYSNRYGT